MREEIWESNSGDIRVSEMTEEHAKNALRMAIRIMNENDFKFRVCDGYE